MSRLKVTMLVIAAVAVSVAMTGCYAVPVDRESTNGTNSQQIDVAAGGATAADVTVQMGVGELKLGSVSTSGTVASGTVRHPAKWPVEVDYQLKGDTGELRFSQKCVGLPFGDADNTWDIDLADGMPMSLRVELGVGESTLDLGRLDLDRLTVQMGTGDTTLDLSGPRKRDLKATLEAGVGALRVVLPEGVGVRVSGLGDGVGDYSADGFRADGESWVNDAWDRPGPKIELDVQRGVGDVELELQR